MPEIVWLPTRRVSSGNLLISTGVGNTRDLGISFRSRNLRRIVNHWRTLRLGERLVFDARFDTDINVAHQVRLALHVLLARREISAALGHEAEITVILRDRAAGYAQALYHQLGVTVLTSDSQVEAQLVRVDDPPVSTYQGDQMILSGGASASVALIPEILTRAEFLTPNSGDLPDKIFISRRASRSITNDPEITSLLNGRGFKKFYFEDEPIERQMLLCRNARAIVAIHGAAMAHTVFNGNGRSRPAGDLSGLRIIELFGPGYSVDLYRRYAGVLNAHWCGVRGQITSEVIRDLDTRNLPRCHETTPFHVDPSSLEMALDYSERASTRPADADLLDQLPPSWC